MHKVIEKKQLYFDEDFYNEVIMMPETEEIELDGYDFDNFDLEDPFNPFELSPSFDTNRLVQKKDELEEIVLDKLDNWEAEVFVSRREEFRDIPLKKSDKPFAIKVSGKSVLSDYPATVFAVKGRIRGGYYVDRLGSIIEQKKEFEYPINFVPLMKGGGAEIKINVPVNEIRLVRIKKQCTIVISSQGLGQCEFFFPRTDDIDEVSICYIGRKKTDKRGNSFEMSSGSLIAVTGNVNLSLGDFLDSVVVDKANLIIKSLSDLLIDMYDYLRRLGIETTKEKKEMRLGPVPLECMEKLCEGEIRSLIVRFETPPPIGTLVSLFSAEHEQIFVIKKLVKMSYRKFRKEWDVSYRNVKFKVLNQSKMGPTYCLEVETLSGDTSNEGSSVSDSYSEDYSSSDSYDE